MNEKEYKIIDSLLQELLGKEDYTFLHQNFENVSKYQVFLQTLLEIIIDKKNEPTLYDIIDLYGISNIYLGFKNKKNAIIEELAELYFNGEKTDNNLYLNETKNEVFLNHLKFLKDTATSIKLLERETLKKKLQNIEQLNAFDLNENEIKIAIKLIERKRLKGFLQNLDLELGSEKPIKESDFFPQYSQSQVEESISKEDYFVPKWEIDDRNEGTNEKSFDHKKDTKIIKLNTLQILKYAAIFIVLIGAGYLVYTGLEQTPQLAKNEKIIKPTVDTIENIKTQPKQDLPKLSPASEINYSTSVLQEQNFGFSSENEKTISIKIIDVTSQLKQITELKVREVKNDYLKNTEDSLLNLQGTYLFEKTKNKVTVYTNNRQIKLNKENSKVIFLNDVYYLNIKNDFYALDENKTFIKLKKLTNEAIIEQLSLLEE